MKSLDIKAKIQIQKPLSEIREAIIDPGQMSGYFIASGSGKMESGKSITWKFPEFDEIVPVRVKDVSEDMISYYWDGSEKETLVTIQLTAKTEKDTLVTITEGSMPDNEAVIKWLKSNTEGWANFLACLKAYMEYGINLRKGAFDFMRK